MNLTKSPTLLRLSFVPSNMPTKAFTTFSNAPRMPSRLTPWNICDKEFSNSIKNPNMPPPERPSSMDPLTPVNSNPSDLNNPEFASLSAIVSMAVTALSNSMPSCGPNLVTSLSTPSHIGDAAFHSFLATAINRPASPNINDMAFPIPTSIRSNRLAGFSLPASTSVIRTTASDIS